MPRGCDDPFRVLLIDDHPLVRAGLRLAIEREPGFLVCGEADCASEARRLVVDRRADVAVVDLVLKSETGPPPETARSSLDGLTLVRDLCNLRDGLRVLVISMLDEAAFGARARQAGAAAFLHKESGLDLVGPALRRLIAGAHPGKTGSSSVPLSQSAAEGIDALSNRELQVFQLIGMGRSTKQIAAALGVSLKTAETHRENIKLKLGLDGAHALIARATLWVREQGLLH